MKISSLLYSSPLSITLGLILSLILTRECGGVLKSQFCLQDMDCMKEYPSSDDTLHSCCDLDYDKDEDFTLYCWHCEYPCNDDQNYCQNQINGATASWKWVYPSNKDKGTRNGSQIPQNLTMSK